MAQGGVACGVLTLLLTVIVCLPIVLILRVDGTLTWSWLLVFIPFWLVNALLCVAIFGRPCFAARAEDAKAADVIALVPWKAAGVLALIIASEVMLGPNPNPHPNPNPNPHPNPNPSLSPHQAVAPSTLTLALALP